MSALAFLSSGYSPGYGEAWQKICLRVEAGVGLSTQYLARFLPDTCDMIPMRRDLGVSTCYFLVLIARLRED
ncbi:hypothetical protein TPY_0280 [Sulfobacillus acidophilus TPY]|nr:hypothetical protein TPY_0280 [Sulfobacillus acidophilus TPY]